MSMSPPPVPQVPDASTVASAQYGYNTQAADRSQAGSSTNQYNPYGSLTYSQTGTGPGGVPMWSANLALTPQEQAIFNQAQGTRGTAATQAKNVLGNANYGSNDPASTIGDATSGNTAKLMSMWSQANQPALTTARSQLDTSLRNQGLFPGQPGYDNAMRGLDTNQTNAIAGASAQFEPAAYAQAFQNYNLPAQLAATLAGLGQAGNPGSALVNAPQNSTQPANYVGAAANQSQSQMAAYQAQLAQQGNMMSGMFGMPSALLGGWAKSGGLSGLGSMFGGGAATGAATDASVAAGADAAGGAAAAGGMADLLPLLALA